MRFAWTVFLFILYGFLFIQIQGIRITATFHVISSGVLASCATRKEGTCLPHNDRYSSVGMGVPVVVTAAQAEGPRDPAVAEHVDIILYCVNSFFHLLELNLDSILFRCSFALRHFCSRKTSFLPVCLCVCLWERQTETETEREASAGRVGSVTGTVGCPWVVWCSEHRHRGHDGAVATPGSNAQAAFRVHWSCWQPLGMPKAATGQVGAGSWSGPSWEPRVTASPCAVPHGGLYGVASG